MLVLKGTKKTKIFFYFFIFIFVSTISFFEKTNISGSKVFFQLNEIDIVGYKKIDPEKMLNEFNVLIGKNLFLIKIKDIEDIINKNKLVNEYKITKQYPNKINIKLTEVNFVAELIKDKKRYFLANNNNLVPFAEYLTDKKLPNIYGKNAEFYFNDFQELLKLHDFNMDIISSYYFFQINRWDLVINNAKVIKFPSKALPEAIKVANKLLNNKDFNKYSVIDLRISNKIIAQ